MKNKALKILLSILLIGITLFIGLIAIVVASLNGDADFYGPFILTMLFFVDGWLIALIFGLLKRKLLIISAICIIILGITSISIYEYHQDYINSIPVVDDQGVNLYEYEPFAAKSKVAKLEEESTLHFSENLPSLDGATALYPLFAAFVRATYPQDEYDPYSSKVTSSTTPEAYENLMSGKADIIFCAAPSQNQIDVAAGLGKEFKMTPIGKEAFVFFVNINNPVSELSLSQIQDIYSGKITNWNMVGGNNEEIKAFQRPKNSGSQTMLEKIMDEKLLISPLKENIASGMGDIIDQTARYKNFENAIGYTFLYFATEMIGNNQIKLLKINGVYPSKETIVNNKYPFVGDFYAITTDTKNENVEKFINWIISDQGQSLVEKTGYVPLAK